MAKAEERLSVFLGDRLVGVLSHPGPRRFGFQYSADVIEEWDGSPVLSASLPVREAPFSNAACKPYFEGLLPEGTVRETLERQFRVAPGDGFRLLREIGRECAGAVIVLPDEAESPEHSFASVDWLTDAELAKRISELAAHPLGVELDGPRLSLGGVQDKLVVVRDAAGRIGLPVGGAPSTHIIKPGHAGYEDIVANEAFCLMTVRSTGLDAANASVLDVAGRPVLLVERFDRTLDGTMRVRRLHQEDMCQALGVLPVSKYESDGGPGLAAIAEGIRGTSSRVASDLATFMRYVAANFLLGNSDAHAKNFAFLYQATSEARLAPLYDVVSTEMYAVKNQLAMSIGSAREPHEVDRGSWEQAARDCGLNARLLVRDLTEFGERLVECAHATRERARAEGWHVGVIDRVVEVAERRLDQVRARSQSAPVRPGERSEAEPVRELEQRLDQQLLFGRVYPYMFNPSISSIDVALVLRGAYAFAFDLVPELRFGSSEQAAFEDAVNSSTLERFVEVLSNERVPREWRATDPTRSNVVTMRRPSSPSIAAGWSIEARFSIMTQQFGVPTGEATALAIADLVIRETDDTDGSRPLSMQDLFDGYWVLVDALVTEVVPQLAAHLPGEPTVDPAAFNAVLTASGRPLSSFVPLDWLGRVRAENMSDVIGGEWPVQSFDQLLDPAKRRIMIREWIDGIHRDSGWSGHEAGVAMLDWGG